MLLGISSKREAKEEGLGERFVVVKAFDKTRATVLLEKDFDKSKKKRNRDEEICSSNTRQECLERFFGTFLPLHS